MGKLKKKLPLILSLSVLCLAVYLKIIDHPLVEKMRLQVFDTFQINHPREYQQLPVRIVDLDDESLKRLGQWPWPRNKTAMLIKRLQELGAAAVALDIVFSEEDRTSPKHIIPLWNKDLEKVSNVLGELQDHDEIFANTIAEANVITGFVLTQDPGKMLPEVKAGFSHAGDDPRYYLDAFQGGLTSLPILEKAAVGNGALNSSPDRDGIIRRISLVFQAQDTLFPTLSAESLRVAQGASTYIIKASEQQTGITHVKVGAFEIPTDASGKFWIYYTPFVKERYVPAWKVLESDYDGTEFIEGNIVLIGTSAAGLKDIRATPFSPLTSGVEVHAQAIEQVIAGEFLRRPDWIHGAELVLMVATGLILIGLMSWLPIIWGTIIMLTVLTGSAAASWYAFTEHRLLIDPVSPSIAIILIYFSESLRQYMKTEQEKRQVRDAFSHYMSPDLVKELEKDPDKLKLGGETKELTTLFCDIRGFTSISETMNAEQLTTFINRFLTPMTTIILENKGTIDKYIGDCIMAFWNAPLDDEQHARNACISALKMIEELETVNIANEQHAKEENRAFIPVNIGIGLNTGECCVGNLGSNQRFDYSVLGDAVNLASRLEGQSKPYGVHIVIGPNTANYIQDFAKIELDLIRVKGKKEPVHIYALLGDEKVAASKEYKELNNSVNAMLEYYRAQKWNKAKEALAECRAVQKFLKGTDLTMFLDLYAERIEAYKKKSPGKEWDGVYIALTK